MKCKEKPQQVGWKEIENSGLCCRHCRRYKNGECTNKFIDQETINPKGFNQCIEPDNRYLLPAVNKIKALLDGNAFGSSAYIKYLRAVVDRYEGATRTMVESDYKLYSVTKEGKKKSQYSMFIKHGLSLAAGKLSPVECAAVAKWVLDDSIYALHEWNPFDRDIEKIKVGFLNEYGKSQVGKMVYLDGVLYRVIDQERGNLFVAMETPDEKAEGTDSWFSGGTLEHYLNTEWLEKHPEAKARLLHKVRILTVDNICDYTEMLTQCAYPYWVSIMPDDKVKPGMGILAKGRNMEMEAVSHQHYIRPAFWIAPSEDTLAGVKRRVAQKVKSIQQKGQKTAPAQGTAKAITMDLPAGCISQMLDQFKHQEVKVYAKEIMVSEQEQEIYLMRLETELTEIYQLSKLSYQDFSCLCRIRDIATCPRKINL